MRAHGLDGNRCWEADVLPASDTQAPPDDHILSCKAEIEKARTALTSAAGDFRAAAFSILDAAPPV